MEKVLFAPYFRKIAKRLGLDPMVANNTDNHETAFTVSVDHMDTTTEYLFLKEHLL